MTLSAVSTGDDIYFWATARISRPLFPRKRKSRGEPETARVHLKRPVAKAFSASTWTCIPALAVKRAGIQSLNQNRLLTELGL